MMPDEPDLGRAMEASARRDDVAFLRERVLDLSNHLLETNNRVIGLYETTGKLIDMVNRLIVERNNGTS